MFKTVDETQEEYYLNLRKKNYGDPNRVFTDSDINNRDFIKTYRSKYNISGFEFKKNVENSTIDSRLKSYFTKERYFYKKSISSYFRNLFEEVEQGLKQGFILPKYKINFKRYTDHPFWFKKPLIDFLTMFNGLMKLAFAVVFSIFSLIYIVISIPLMIALPFLYFFISRFKQPEAIEIMKWVITVTTVLAVQGFIETVLIPILLVKTIVQSVQTLWSGTKKFGESDTIIQAFTLAENKLEAGDDKIALNIALTILHEKTYRAYMRDKKLPFEKKDEETLFESVEDEMCLGTLNQDSDLPISDIQKQKITAYLNFFKPCIIKNAQENVANSASSNMKNT